MVSFQMIMIDKLKDSSRISTAMSYGNHSFAQGAQHRKPMWLSARVDQETRSGEVEQCGELGRNRFWCYGITKAHIDLESDVCRGNACQQGSPHAAIGLVFTDRRVEPSPKPQCPWSSSSRERLEIGTQEWVDAIGLGRDDQCINAGSVLA